MAEFAHRQRIPSVCVLADDSNPNAQDMAFHFELAARRLGLHVVGSSTWGPSADNYTRLAQQVASSGAHAAFLGGTINPGAILIRALRQRLGPRVPILADDGFLPLGPLFQAAGSAARDLYISTAVVPNAPLPPAGHAIVAHLGAIRHNAPLNLAALYAA